MYLHDFTIHGADRQLDVIDAGERLSTLYGVGFYISSTPSNIAHAIINIEAHYSLQVFRLLHFSFSPLIPAYDSTLPAADPFISGFDVLIFSHQHVPISTMWCPAPLKAIPAPQCYLQHIPIHPMKREIVRAAPSFLTAHASNRNPLPQSLYSFLIQSLNLPAPAPFSSSPQSTPCHLLFEANPTYYLSLIPALYSSFICLTSAAIPSESNISSLSNWLLSFLSKFLSDSDLSTLCADLETLLSHPGFSPLPPKTSALASSSSSSTSARQPRKSLG